MKKTMKTIISIVLMMTMLMSVLAVLSVGVSAEESDPIKWDGATLEQWGNLNGSGTEEDPYLIEDPVDWIAMILGAATWFEEDTQYFKLTADLDFDNIGLNAISTAVSLKLDGDGHTIYNYKAADGFAIAKYLEEGSVIKNLNFVNLQASGKNVAGIARDARNGSVLIENVTIDATSVIANSDLTAAQAASAFICNAYSDLTIRNCVNYATVNGGYEAGAFLAGIAGDANVTIENCVNYGTVTAGVDAEWNAVNTYSYGCYVGGLVGGAGGSNFNITIKNSANRGEVAGGSTVQTNVGGIYGSFFGVADSQATSSTFTIENSYNAGELYGFGKHAYMGGIVSMFYYKGSVNIQNVYNTGGVYPDATNTNCAMGIVGFSTNAEISVTFKDLYSLPGDTEDFAVHKCNPDPAKTEYVEENTGIVANIESEITLATGASTIKAEIEAINAAIEAGMACAAAGHDFAFACSPVCDDCGATRNVACSGEFTCSATCQYCEAAIAPAAEHTYDDGVITTPATHLAEGVKTFTCEWCGDTYTEEIEKTTEHAWDEGVVTTPATHLAEGVKTFTCECNETKTEKIEKTTEHTWDEGVVTTPATEEAEGVKTFTCECGETKTEVIAKLPATTPDAPATDDAPATEAPATEEETKEEGGCGASVAGLGALLALTASFGFAFVGKKED